MNTPMHSTPLVSMLCLLGVLVGFGCSLNNSDVRVVGSVSTNDLSAIRETVHRELITRWGSTDGRPIKTIEVTTNNSYWNDLHLLSAFEAYARTNSSLEGRLGEVRERIRSRSAGEATNLAVHVWYADSSARWGEAGYALEKKDTQWKVFSQLFR
jgi:hypothetical protein